MDLVGRVLYSLCVNSRTTPMPRLPAAARRAGATKVARTGPHTFNVSFKISENIFDYLNEGHGPAVVRALAAKYGDAAVRWQGSQTYAINLDLSL